MPLAPFATRPRPGEDPARRGRLAVLLAVLGIAAALLAYAISPGVRSTVKRAARSVGHAVTHVFKGSGRRPGPALPANVLVAPRVTLGTLHSRPALVTFWDAACLPCGREAHAVEQFATSPAGRGRVVGVDFDDSTSAARGFIRHHRWTFPNLRDSRGRVGRRYGVKGPAGLPVTYFLDPGGHIALALSGPLTETRMAGGLRTAGK
jgi:peroxiredoxin